jgi:hypothetical protein
MGIPAALSWAGSFTVTTIVCVFWWVIMTLFINAFWIALLTGVVPPHPRDAASCGVLYLGLTPVVLNALSRSLSDSFSPHAIGLTEWYKFVINSVLNTALFDALDTYGIAFTNIKAISFFGSTVIFMLKLVTISLVLAVIAAWIRSRRPAKR